MEPDQWIENTGSIWKSVPYIYLIASFQMSSDIFSGSRDYTIEVLEGIILPPTSSLICNFFLSHHKLFNFQEPW